MRPVLWWFAVTSMAIMGTCVVDGNLVLLLQQLPKTSHWQLAKDEVVCDSDGKVKPLRNVHVEAVRSSKMENYTRAYELYVSALKERSLKYAALLTAYGYKAATTTNQQEGSDVACPKVLCQLKEAFETIKGAFGRWTRGRKLQQLEWINMPSYVSMPSSQCTVVLKSLKTYLETLVLSRYPARLEHDNSSLMERAQKECQLIAESKNDWQVLKTYTRPFDGNDLAEIYRSVLDEPTVAFEVLDFLGILGKVNEEYKTDSVSVDWDSTNSEEAISDELFDSHDN